MAAPPVSASSRRRPAALPLVFATAALLVTRFTALQPLFLVAARVRPAFSAEQAFRIREAQGCSNNNNYNYNNNNYNNNNNRIKRLPRGRGGGDAAEVLSPGDAVEAVFGDDGHWYSAVLEKGNADGTFEVRWDDPDGGPEVSTVQLKDIKKYVPPIPMDQLQVGAKYTGTVVSTAGFGAFVNIGAERDGLVHVSCVKEGFVENIDDELQAGQQVTVWVKQVVDGKLGLTMVESKLSSGGGPRTKADLSKFKDLTWGDRLKGTVVSVTNFGAFVSVMPPSGGDATQGLVHVSEMSDTYVEDPFSVVQQGQEVEVYVKDIDVTGGRLSLSMKSPPS